MNVFGFRALPILAGLLLVNPVFGFPSGSTCKNPLEKVSRASQSKSNAKVTEIIGHLEKKFDQSLAEFGGIGSIEKKLRQNKDSRVQSTLKWIDSPQAEFAINVPSRLRNAIVKNGFENQFVTHSTSSGIYNPEYRLLTEAYLAKMTLEDYQNLDDKLKPKHAYLKPTGSEFPYRPALTETYGHDIYIFKKERTEAITYTIGDALDAHYYETNWGNENDWISSFIPWNRAFLIAPTLLDSQDQGLKYLSRDFSGLNYPNKMYPRVIKGMTAPAYQSGLNYVNLQLWGIWTLDDVEAFEFSGPPPQGAFLKELQRRGIEIRDKNKKP